MSKCETYNSFLLRYNNLFIILCCRNCFSWLITWSAGWSISSFSCMSILCNDLKCFEAFYLICWFSFLFSFLFVATFFRSLNRKLKIKVYFWSVNWSYPTRQNYVSRTSWWRLQETSYGRSHMVLCNAKGRPLPTSWGRPLPTSLSRWNMTSWGRPNVTS